MRVIVRNGITVEVISVNYACFEDLKLIFQDVVGDWYGVSGFSSTEEIKCCLIELYRAGYYDLTGYDSVEYLDDSDDDGGDD